MIKVYLKQAWELLKQNKLYSSVYIIGTGMAIAMIMTVAIVLYVKMAPVYPEENRSRTLVFGNLSLRYTDGGMSSSGLSYSFIRDYLSGLESAEAVTAVLRDYGSNNYVEHPQTGKQLPVSVKYSDHNFWNVFTFDFIHGQPFTEEEFRSAIPAAIIAASLAQKLFGTTEVTGRRMMLDADEYKISGVVRDASLATPSSYAQIWLPFTLKSEKLESTFGEGYLGPFSAYLLAHSSSETAKVTQEAEEMMHKINTSQEKFELNSAGRPEPFWKSHFHKYNNHAIDWQWVFGTYGVMLLALLFVPAVNLAGMVSSRMEKRLPEMGIRKAFGASRGTLMYQILTENFVLTLLGGVAGLIFSWLIVYSAKYWIFTLMTSWPQLPVEGTDYFVSPSMLFNPGVFIIALLVCLMLNLVSAIIPAHNGLKKNIIYSLNEKA